MKLAVLIAALLAAAASAFVPRTSPRPSPVRVQAQRDRSFDPLGVADPQQPSPPAAPAAAGAFAAAAAAALAARPLAALAEGDDYEYGAVDAPIGLAVAGGLLAILTALLPVALKGGEEAFEEMKDRDSSKWGK